MTEDSPPSAIGHGMIGDEEQEKIGRLYNEYTHTFKPLLAAVEVQQQELPSAILNEIRYFTDHISRCYWPEATQESIADNVRMAHGHLKRACLDCMKHSILYLHERCIEDFEKRYRFVDLNAVADGSFNAQYHELERRAKDLHLTAKLQETREADEVVFEAFQNALDAFYELEKFIDRHARGLRNARVWFSVRSKGSWLASLAITVILTILVSAVLEDPIRSLFTAIRSWFP